MGNSTFALISTFLLNTFLSFMAIFLKQCLLRLIVRLSVSLLVLKNIFTCLNRGGSRISEKGVHIMKVCVCVGGGGVRFAEFI